MCGSVHMGGAAMMALPSGPSGTLLFCFIVPCRHLAEPFECVKETWSEAQLVNPIRNEGIASPASIGYGQSEGLI